MLTIQRIKPFLTSREDFRLRLVFAYQYFSIVKGEEVFQFVPSEGKEIIVNLNSLQVENLGEIFVFQRGSRFIRLPLYQLLLISDLHIHLSIILEEVVEIATDSAMPNEIAKEAEGIIQQLETDNKWRMIDYALETNNRSLFNELTEGLH